MDKFESLLSSFVNHVTLSSSFHYWCHFGHWSSVADTDVLNYLTPLNLIFASNLLDGCLQIKYFIMCDWMYHVR